MYKPRSVPNKLNIEDIKAEIAVLTSEINAPEEAFDDEISDNKVIQILKNEVASLNEFIEYERKRKKTLISEKERISRYIEEEENIITCCNNYILNESFMTSEKIDAGIEMFFKLEVLHRKICSLMKKFSHNYFSIEESKPYSSDEDIDKNATIIYESQDLEIDQNSEHSEIDQNSEHGDMKLNSKFVGIEQISECAVVEQDTEELSVVQSSGDLETERDNQMLKPKKSLLDILKILLPEITFDGAIGSVLIVDDTVLNEHIEFLLSANIVERCEDDPKIVKLIE